MHIVVVGAGVGGLTAGALLLKSGYRVTVLESQVYPGGCAATFYHQGYRFDAGATLAGGFLPGGPHARLAEILGIEWPVDKADPAWTVHLADRQVTQWADPERWRAERQAAFPGQESFWRKQEYLANLAWDISQRPFPWPPGSLRELAALAGALRPRSLGALPYLARTVRDLQTSREPLFDTFLDAQLIIAAQTTGENANALYGSAALDLPRRGVSHVRGGIGALARTLAGWISAHGGEVLYRQQVEHIEVRDGRAQAVYTTKGLRLEADGVLVNTTPWAAAALLGDSAPAGLRREARGRTPTWGAFTLYLGLDAGRLPAGLTDHHQIVVDPARPLGEANSVFISLSPAGDLVRAPAGHRAATLSTHTVIEPWNRLRWSPDGPQAYEQRKADYTERMLAAAEGAIPGLRAATRLCLPGTPATFEFFTRRPMGMVGGFPQTSLFAARGPGLGLANAWLVGDSVFPGQSTAGVTLGGMRVAAVAQGALGRVRRFAGFEGMMKGSI